MAEYTDIPIEVSKVTAVLCPELFFGCVGGVESYMTSDPGIVIMSTLFWQASCKLTHCLVY